MKYSAARCRVCEEILTSKFRHDYNQCECLNQTAIDGGNDYIKIGGMDLSLIDVGQVDSDTGEFICSVEQWGSPNEN